MAAMPDAEDRAAMRAPLLPRPTFLSASFSSFTSPSSSSSSPSPTTSASSSPTSSFPPPASMPTPHPSPQPPQVANPWKALAVLRDHAGSISSLSLCGEFLLSASTGGDIVAWQQPDLRRFARFGHGGHGGGSVKALVASGGRVFSAHQDGRVRVWRVSRGRRSENAFKLVAALPTARDYLGRVFRHASSYVQPHQLTRHHQRRRLWIEHADSISCLAVAGATTLLYSGSWDRTIKVWRVADLKCVESIHAHDDAVNAVAADADAGVVYSASADGRVKAWEKGKTTHFLRAVLVARDGVSWNALAVAAAGRRVYAAGSDGRLAGWDRLGGGRAGWTLACDVRAHDAAVLCLCVVRERDLLCTGSADRTIGLWHRQRGGGGELAKVGVVAGHEGPVKCIQASWCRLSNGCMVYSGGLDKTIRVWWVPGALQHGNGNEQHQHQQQQQEKSFKGQNHTSDEQHQQQQQQQQQQQEKSFKDQNQTEKAPLFLR